MLTILHCLRTYLPVSNKPQLHQDWFLINCGRLVNLKGPEFGPSHPNHAHMHKVKNVVCHVGPKQKLFCSSDSVRFFCDDEVGLCDLSCFFTL